VRLSSLTRLLASALMMRSKIIGTGPDSTGASARTFQKSQQDRRSSGSGNHTIVGAGNTWCEPHGLTERGQGAEISGASCQVEYAYLDGGQVRVDLVVVGQASRGHNGFCSVLASVTSGRSPGRSAAALVVDAATRTAYLSQHESGVHEIDVLHSAALRASRAVDSRGPAGQAHGCGAGRRAAAGRSRAGRWELYRGPLPSPS
jgi:hypothetical protein